MSSLNTRRGWQFGSTRPDMQSFQSGKTLELMSTSMFTNTQATSPQSPTRPPGFPYSEDESAGEKLPMSRQRASSCLPYTLCSPPVRFNQSSPPEIHVQVESHRALDTCLPPPATRIRGKSLSLPEHFRGLNISIPVDEICIEAGERMCEDDDVFQGTAIEDESV